MDIFAGEFTKNWIKEYSGSLEEKISKMLLNLNIMAPKQKILNYKETKNWTRYGESYVACADTTIITKENEIKQRPFAIKAITRLFPEKVVNDMVRRRTYLKKHHINVPKLYDASNGCLTTEFLPYDIKKMAQRGLITKELLKQIRFIGATLDEKGFTALNYIRDLRATKTKVFYNDLGGDLGEPSQQKKNISNKIYHEFLDSYPHLRSLDSC